MDSHGKCRNSNGSMISCSIPKNGGAAGNDNVDDSRYGHGSTILMNERPSMDDKDVNPSTSHQNSILPSRGWDDIFVYNAKKLDLGCCKFSVVKWILWKILGSSIMLAAWISENVNRVTGDILFRCSKHEHL
ncbi:hypothetical protein L6452_08973 [Arctium lappa]|uniref:Uncharacterized protein n=1 Tax=Arctium lappa TaxID=4217 RepID=A0ACB9DIS2_ARCLA|nr:hypothetical protein L6452_08973 [Arctium lappa]